jgi:hypothetical protein
MLIRWTILSNEQQRPRCIPESLSNLIAINRSASCRFSKEGKIDTTADIKASGRVRRLQIVGMQIVQE